jgi:Putative peptidoglycan binding domain
MSRTLSIGMTGQDVADLQAALNYHMRTPTPPHTPPGPARPPLNVDGQFGSKTDARLREFQILNGLVADGAVGRNTRPLLTKAKQVIVKVPLKTRGDPPVSSIPSLGRGSDARAFNLTRVSQALPLGQSKPLVAPLQLQNRQVQSGGSFTLKPILGSGDPSAATVLSVQWTWVEQRDGIHFELAQGGQFAAPLTNETLGLSPSAQTFAQITLADVLVIDPANFHLFSPSAQISFQANSVQGVIKSVAAGASIQNQISWDLEKQGNNPVFSLFCQQQLAWTYDFSEGKGSIAPGLMLGATWQTTLF